MAILHKMVTSDLADLSNRSPTTHSVVKTLRVVNSSKTGGENTTPERGVEAISLRNDLALMASSI